MLISAAYVSISRLQYYPIHPSGCIHCSAVAAAAAVAAAQAEAAAAAAGVAFSDTTFILISFLCRYHGDRAADGSAVHLLHCRRHHLSLSLTPSLSPSLSLLYSLQCQGFTHHLTLPLFFFFISFSSLVPSPCRRPGVFQRSPIFSFASVVVAESAASAAAATAACRP